jgi:hypothetical protein
MWVVLNYPEHFKMMMMMIEKDVELDETVMFWKEMRTHTCKSKNKDCFSFLSLIGLYLFSFQILQGL